MVADFQPKGEEVLQAEALEDLGLEGYEGNEEVIDRVVARLKSAEDLKASLHTDKMSNREKLKEARKLLGQDPETGEKLSTNVVVEPKNETRSVKDMVKDGKALSDLDNEEDMDEVIDYAERKNMTLSEARKSPFIQSFLKTQADLRKTADTVQVRTAGRGFSSKSHDEKVLEDYENGIVPEDPAALAQARYNAILKKRKN